MGNRANLVIVENGNWDLHYAHWAGCRMLDGFAFGAADSVMPLTYSQLLTVTEDVAMQVH